MVLVIPIVVMTFALLMERVEAKVPVRGSRRVGTESLALPVAPPLGSARILSRE